MGWGWDHADGLKIMDLLGLSFLGMDTFEVLKVADFLGRYLILENFLPNGDGVQHHRIPQNGTLEINYYTGGSQDIPRFCCTGKSFAD